MSSVVLVDEGGMALVKDKVVKDWVYIGHVKLTMWYTIFYKTTFNVRAF